MKRNLYALSIAIMLIICPSGYTQQGKSKAQITGYVYHDKNKNAKMDNTEMGIARVAVSNGLDVVVTDTNGHYTLPVSDDTPIFVVKPAGWMTPVNEVNLPLFYYLHKPNGSPEDYEFAGVPPTGSLPEQLNFPLYRNQETNTFKMVVFGDPQPYDIDQIDYMAEDIVRELIGRDDLEFGMTMGDIVGDDLDLFTPLNETVAQIGIPWYNVIGNHDINFDAPSDILSDETYERIYGPSTYAFVYGHVHFIVVDDVIYLNENGSKNYVGGLRPDQLKFVENYLKTVSKEDLVVLTMHIPLAKHGTNFRNSDQKKLFDLLDDFPHTLSISAHTHVHDNHFYHQGASDWQRPTPHHHFNVGTTSGSWWNGLKGETNIPHTMMRDGTPNGYSFITFKGIDYIIDWKVAGSPAKHQMNIHVPRGIKAQSDENPQLTVNFFNGSEQSTIEYRIIGISQWQKMEKVNKIDPFYEMIAQRWEYFQNLGLIEKWEADSSLAKQLVTGDPMPKPQPSTHIWSAEIGTDFNPGRYIIEVRATDRYGQVFEAVQTMRVTSENSEE